MAAVEEWRTVPGHTRYSVSNRGRVRNTRTGRILRQSDNGKGYVNVGLVPDGQACVHTTFSVHRLVATAFIPNPEGLPHIDHINRQKLDNRAENLRWAKPHLNGQNNGLSRRNTSGYKGVYFNKGAQKWMAYIRHEGKLKYLGLFDDPEEASAHRDQVGKELYGEFYTTTSDAIMEMIESL
jgi:hypothetical protein